MKKLIQEFVYGFISLEEFRERAIYVLMNYYGGEMSDEEILAHGKAIKILGEEIINHVNNK